MKLTVLFKEFFNSEKSGGLLLIGCTLISLTLANSAFQSQYFAVWSFPVGGEPLSYWINDGLMTIFFLLIGLELEREIYIGELSDFRSSILPVFAAAGGMLIPAAIHLAFNSGTIYQRGAGIPMATDIAFALGILSILGKKVPGSLKVFLTALAVIDDLGAIIIIAIFYTDSIHWQNLLIALGIFSTLIILNRLRFHNLVPYLLGGVAMWYFMHNSGVHATITGVLLAFAIPFGDGDEKSPSYILQHFLHLPVAFLVLPLFALANTSIQIPPDVLQVLITSNSIGIISGLIIGKPLGVVLFTFLVIRLRLSALPEGMKPGNLAGAGFLGGIGFTMSIFITILAYDQPALVEESKIAVMLASLIAGVTGFFIIKYSQKNVIYTDD